MIKNSLQHLSTMMANSFLLEYGKKLWEANTRNWNLPLNKIQKIIIGVYIILLDYGQGKFPPTFSDQKEAYCNEVNYHKSIPGSSISGFHESEMRKPFAWGSLYIKRLVLDYVYILGIIEKLGLKKTQIKILELGCGTGWMTELFALSDYNITGISIAPFEIEMAKKRIESLNAKRLRFNLEFFVSGMESVKILNSNYEFVFVYEALHHAFSYEETFQSVYNVLMKGGYFFICKEPNLIHTFVAYRGTKQLKTHEIGLSRRKMIIQLRKCGFKNIKYTRNRFNNFLSPHWILAQKI